MNKFCSLLTVTLSLIFTTAIAAKDRDRHDDELEFKARLSGEQEVPPVSTETRGRFKIEFDDDFAGAEFKLRIRDGQRVTMVHIHCAREGQNGPVVAWLAGFHERGWDVDGKWIDNATLTDDNVIASNPADNPTCPNMIENLTDLAEAMLDGNTYVNVHTIAVPSGEVRGQIYLD